MAFQSLFSNSLGTCLVTLLSTSVKSCKKNQLGFSVYSIYIGRTTDRNEKARRPICALKKVWKQLQPRIVAVHDQLPSFFCPQLCEPGILRSKCRRCIALGEVQDYIEEGGDRACSHGFDAGHRNGRGGSVSCEWYSRAIADQTVHRISIHSNQISPRLSPPLSKGV